MTGGPRVASVFGSGAPTDGTEDYARAREVGALLAGAGWTVQTGGYGGVMEAASRGAAEAGGHVVGVTSEAVEAWRPLGRNAWVREEVRCRTLQERLERLVRTCDAAVVMPGGVGTLAELALVWNLVLVRELPPRPIVTVGAFWDTALRHLSSPDYVRPDQAALVRSVAEPAEALAYLARALPDPEP